MKIKVCFELDRLIFSSFSMFFDFIYYLLIVNKNFKGVNATPVRSNQTKNQTNKKTICPCLLITIT